MPAIDESYVTDENGEIIIRAELNADNYNIIILKNGTATSVTLDLSNQTEATKTSIISSLSFDASGDGGVWLNLADQAFFSAISGIVSDQDGNPIVGAIVGVSGGTATNGTFAMAYTDDLGQYSLLINVNQTPELIAALQEATIRITADGFETKIITEFDVPDDTILTGVNYTLVGTSEVSIPLFLETFEVSSSTSSSWVFDQTSDFMAPYFEDIDVTDASVDNLWHFHANNLAITNQAYTDMAVKLSPWDDTLGAIPDPAEGEYCIWFGDTDRGHFIGGDDIDKDATDDGGNELFYFGGTGIKPVGGIIASPEIDLTNVSTETPISLTFKSWWEIESVNPNSAGFDMLVIFWREQGTQTWNELARLNPLSDPIDKLDRAPIPFSNTGYNSAPTWLQQEPIPLEGAQGKNIQIAFGFYSMDTWYNGFRGWLIDDIAINAVEGTFPTSADINDTSTDTPEPAQETIGIQTSKIQSGILKSRWRKPTRK